MSDKTFEDMVDQNPDSFDSMDCRPGATALVEPMEASEQNPAGAVMFVQRGVTLLRGLSAASPTEIWDCAALAWKPYTGDVPINGGYVISRRAAWRLMTNDHLGLDFGSPE
jgi:hypothetical protein